VASEKLAVFTGTTLKPRFYYPTHPQNHTKKKEERKEERGRENTRLVMLIIFYVADFETTRCAPVQEPVS